MFLKKIAATIGHAITALWHVIAPTLQTQIILAVGAAQILKTAAGLDAGNVIGKMAGAGGEEMEKKLKRALPDIIDDLKIADSFIVKDNLGQTLVNISQKIRFAKDSDWDLFWHNLGLKIADETKTENISFGELIHLVQWVHDNKPLHPDGTVAIPVVSMAA